MAKVTVELTLEQLIEAVKRLRVEDQLKLVQSLFKQEPQDEAAEAWNQGPNKEQVKKQVKRLVQQLRASDDEQALEGPDKWLEEDDGDVTVFTDLEADDFQA